MMGVANYRAMRVFLVDDQTDVLIALNRLLTIAGYTCRTFSSAQEFLDSDVDHEAGCLVLDMAMPGINGATLQARLVEIGSALPIIFLTGHADIECGIRAMKAGAWDFLTKPVDSLLLLEVIEQALKRCAQLGERRRQRARFEQSLAALTPREREVFDLVMTGKRNKEIALVMGITEKTVKLHRARVMEKMHAGSLLELILFCQSADLPTPASQVGH